MLARAVFFVTLFHISAGCLLAETVYLTTTATEVVGGIVVRDGDVALFDTNSNSATLIFNEDLFAANEEVDAFQMLSNGNILLSTVDAASLGGLSFGGGDVIEYNINTDTATVFFDSSLFAATENIDAFHALADGTMLISTATAATLGGISFEDGDIIQYDPNADAATVLFAESLFTDDEDVDAVHLMSNDVVRLSTGLGATLGGLTFEDGDIVDYNLTTDVATLVTDESIFIGGADINGLAVPEFAPSGIWMLALLAFSRPRRPR